MADKGNNINGAGLINFDGISINTSTHIIAVSQDKLLRILDKYTDKVKKQKQWITPLSIAFTLLISLLTSDFKDFIGITAAVWKTTFIIIFLICTVLTGYLFFNKKTPPNVDELVDEIKELK